MRKQYTIIDDVWSKKIVKTYHDGKIEETKLLWLNEVDEYIEQLEKDGYTFGYTQEQVNQARQDYEYKRANMINDKEV